MTILCSLYFAQNNPDLIERARGILQTPHLLAAARNHAKIACFEFVTGAKLVFSGSANLRSNACKENLEITSDASTHDWYAAFIDQEVQDAQGK